MRTGHTLFHNERGSSEILIIDDSKEGTRC